MTSSARGHCQWRLLFRPLASTGLGRCSPPARYRAGAHDMETGSSGWKESTVSGARSWIQPTRICRCFCGFIYGRRLALPILINQAASWRFRCIVAPPTESRFAINHLGHYSLSDGAGRRCTEANGASGIFVYSWGTAIRPSSSKTPQALGSCLMRLIQLLREDFGLWARSSNVSVCLRGLHARRLWFLDLAAVVRGSDRAADVVAPSAINSQPVF